MTMDLREQRGLVIAATCKITQERRITDKRFHVPSSSQDGKKYKVVITEHTTTCTCPDFEDREMACKHIHAVRFVMKQEENADGSTTVTESVTVSETVVKRKTYKQNWPAYNAAQTNEKRWFLSLLADLCAPIPEPERKNLRGRPIPLRDAVYAACFKVFSGYSARRFTCDLEDAASAGHISRPVHFNSVLNVFDNEAVTPILTDLVCRSASPLRTVEDSFAVDSTGISGCRYDRWFDEKWGTTRTCGNTCRAALSRIPAKDRFWKYVNKDGPIHPTLGKCWVWFGNKVKGGYGSLRVDRRAEGSHRYSWTLRFGESPGELCVLHKCDNPACVNPDHLFLGTRLDNNADRNRKGRDGDHKGVANGRAKLTDDQIREIRTRYKPKSRKHGAEAMGREFGVGAVTIRSAARLKTWTHIT